MITVEVCLKSRGRKHFECEPEEVETEIRNILDRGFPVLVENKCKVYPPQQIDSIEFGIPT